jgi:hypothetical protein
MNRLDLPRAPGRREFLRNTAGAAALALLDWPTAAMAWTASRPSPVRVRGVVRTPFGGLHGVAVTDGLSVVDTAADGSYELITTRGRPFVHVSLPAGHRVPVNATGTANFYRPIAVNGAEAEAVFDLEPLVESDDRHAFIVLADIQTEDATEMAWFHDQTVPDVQATLGGVGRENVFGLALGDIMFDHLELFPEFERGVSRMGIPFFQVVGNHDLDLDAQTDERSTATFQRHFGPPWYSFDRGAVHYVVLDNVFWHGDGYLGYVGADQLAWLDADLARVEPGRPVVVALHIPILGTRHLREGDEAPWRGLSTGNRDALYALLEPYPATILAGHTHENEHLFANGVHEHVCAAVCGAWWSGPICADGTPNGYVVYEVDGESLRWRYRVTGKAEDHGLRVYPAGADPAAPDEFVANVWDWDPEWRVTWLEDGIRRGEMTPRVGHDPLSVRLHQGPALPPRRTWVDPYPTGHLFYAPAGEGDLVVEATDRFGRVLSAVVLTPEKGVAVPER